MSALKRSRRSTILLLLLLLLLLCMLSLLYIREFIRLLPLPSDSWEEFSGSVFCHYHSHHAKGKDEDDHRTIIAPSTFTVLPRDGDCLTSASVILLTDYSLDWQHIYKVWRNYIARVQKPHELFLMLVFSFSFAPTYSQGL